MQHKLAKPFKSKIHFGNEVWTWRVRGYECTIREPNCMRTHCVELEQLTGDIDIRNKIDDNEHLKRHPWDAELEGCKPWDGIKPSQIKKYISEYLIPTYKPIAQSTPKPKTKKKTHPINRKGHLKIHKT